MMNIGADGAPTIATAYSQFTQTPEGRQVRLGIYDSREGGKFTSIVDLQNKYADNWVLYDGQEFEALRRAARETADDDLVKEYQGREEKELALIEVANVATDLLDITMRAEKEPQLVTTAGALGEWYNSFTNNVNALYNLFNQGGDFISVNDVVFAKQNGRSALTLGRLLKASNAYSQTIGQTTAQAQADEDELVQALIAVRDAGVEQGALGQWLNLDNDGLKKLVRDRGALVSGQLRLAYAAAAADGQTGTSLSDKDVANFLTQVGFGSQEATDIGAKISKFVKERLQTFDTGKFRALSNQARRHEQRDIDATNNVLISTFRVPESDLTALAEVEVGSDEERRLVNKIDRQIQRISGGSAGHEFIYDSVNKRYRYKPVLERFQKYPGVYRKYMEKYFPHYGITEAEINLDYLEDDDETTQSRAINRTYTPRAIVQ
jgi:DNA-directed RNA polymerase delta subunit